MMREMGRMRRLSFLPFMLMVMGWPGLTVWSQPQGDKEYDLTWKLPHDRAAVYEVYDGATGARRGDFWLLGCELDGRIGATDTRDLPFRYIFRRPPPKVKVGSQWEVRETAFEGAPFELGVSPLEIIGTFKVRNIKTTPLREHFKLIPRNHNNLPANIALIDAHLDIYRCNRIDGKGIVRAENKPSAVLLISTAISSTDASIVAARYQWIGRSEFYTVISNPSVKRAPETAELFLTASSNEISMPALNGRITSAVEKGITYLQSIQQKDGRLADSHYPVGTSGGIGSTALSLLALLHSGVHPHSPPIKLGFSYITSKKVTQSYDLALCLMAIEGRYLQLGTISDIESYSESTARNAIRKSITKEDYSTATDMTRAILNTQSESGMFGYSDGAGYPNLSSTQYAMLGLKSASRMGVKIPPQVWRKALSYIKKSVTKYPMDVTVTLKSKNGLTSAVPTKSCGWGYIHENVPDSTGSMTTAALSIIAICESELVREKEWQDEDSRTYDELALGGWGWIQEHFGLRATPPEGCNYAASMIFGYLYGMERASILWEIQNIGGHDWYLEGAALILSWQKPDGSWTGPHGSTVIDTAWALLFLKRGTLPLDMTRPRIASVDATPRVTEPPRQP